MRYDVYDKAKDIHWQWLQNSSLMPWYQIVVNKSLGYLAGEKGTILDIGSGDGAVDKILVAFGFKVIGIEPEEEGNKIARMRVPEMSIINSTLEDATLPEVDYLYSLNTIEHVKEPKKFIEAMKKVKKFGIVITDNAEIRKGGKYHNKEFTIRKLKNLFKDFKCEELDLGVKDFIGLKITK